MKEISAEARERYYAEVSIRLREAGFEPRSPEDGLLPVDWQGSRLCRLTAGGGAQFREEYVCYTGTLSLDELMMGDPAEQEETEGPTMGGMA